MRGLSMKFDDKELQSVFLEEGILNYLTGDGNSVTIEGKKLAKDDIAIGVEFLEGEILISIKPKK